MYFGDYLVKEKIINSNHLISALCFQLENMPSIIRLLYESHYVTADDLLSAITGQIKQDVDVLEVLQKSNKISLDQINELGLKQISHKIPLGETLVKLNILSKPQLENHLDNYFKYKEKISENRLSDQESNLGTDSNPDINDAALESLRELGVDISQFSSNKVDPLSAVEPRLEVNHFLNLFSEKQKNKMLKLIEILQDANRNSLELSNYFNSLFRDFHLLKGAASFSEITLLDPILNSLDVSIDNILLSGESGIKNWCEMKLPILKKILESLWNIRQSMERDKSDLGLTVNDQDFQELNKLLKQI